METTAENSHEFRVHIATVLVNLPFVTLVQSRWFQ
jgi:hypothetical protein